MPAQPHQEETVSLRASDVEIVTDVPESGPRRVAPPPSPPDPVRAESTPPPGSGRRFGKYELLGRFAYGGMAEIYLAREATAAEMDRYLVLKCLRPAVVEQEDFLRLFHREARLALQLKHPNICHIYEMGREQGRFYLAMEWVEGESLLNLLKAAAAARSHLPMPVVVKVIADVADALDYAHTVRDRNGNRLGVVHRDVSPQNIAIGYDGMVKLLDFGVAKVQSEQTQTRAGLVAGKFGYMSPEQCNDRRLDGRSDIFSLGVVLYEALTGHRLYHRSNEYETMKAIIEDPPPDLSELRPDLSDGLAEIVRRALAKRPQDRFDSARDMALALQQFLTDHAELVTSGHVAEVMQEYFREDIRRGIPELVRDTELMRILPVQSAGPEPKAAVAAPRKSDPPLDLDEPFSVPSTPAHPPTHDVPRRRVLRHAWSLPVRATRFVARRPLMAAASVGAAFLVMTTLSFLGGVVAGEADGPEVVDAHPSLEVRPMAASSLSGAAGPGAAPVPDPAPSGAEAPAGTAESEGGETGQPTAPPAGAAEVPAAEPDPAPGLRIQTRPEGVRVRIDGEAVQGRTPLTVEGLEPGDHEVTLFSPGYDGWRGTVTIPEDGSATIRHALEPRGAATVNINTHPWSRVYIGQRLLGTTPIAGARVPAGEMRLRLVDRDGTEHYRLIDLERGTDKSLYYDLHE